MIPNYLQICRRFWRIFKIAVGGTLSSLILDPTFHKKMLQSNKIALGILILAGAMTAYAQQSFVIRGKVVDAAENAPLPSATIRIAGSMQGTITNA